MDETPRSTHLRGVPDRPFDGRAACGLLRATRPPNRLPFCPHRSPACGAPCPQRARAFDSSLDLRERGALDVSRAHWFPPRARSDSPTSPACGAPCRNCFKRPRSRLDSRLTLPVPTQTRRRASTAPGKPHPRRAASGRTRRPPAAPAARRLRELTRRRKPRTSHPLLRLTRRSRRRRADNLLPPTRLAPKT